MRKRSKSWLNLKWVERQPMKVKLLVGILILGFCLVGLRHLVKYGNGFPLFVASQFIHLSGIIILIFKLIKTKTCSGKFHFFFCFLLWSYFHVYVMFFFWFLSMVLMIDEFFEKNKRKKNIFLFPFLKMPSLRKSWQ